MFWWMDVALNWSTKVKSATGRYFGPVVTSVHIKLFSILENNLIGYADDSTLIAVVPSPGFRVTVTSSE